MSLTRRAFLNGAAALPLVAAVAAVAAAGRARAAPRVLTAAPARVRLAPPGYPETGVWAYDGQVPGRTLRVARGGEVNVRLVNGLDEPTTIHWHGLRLPNAMDGVPGMTQAALQPGESFDYRFVARDAGTFWYHPHANSVEQISRGLAGVLVVEDDTPPDADADEVLVLDDWRLTDGGAIHESFGNRHDLSHAGRLGNYVTVNGASEPAFDVRPGQRLRLRLVNVATARIFSLRMPGLRAWVAALDGMPLDRPRAVDALVLAPAQRADLLVDVVAEAGGEAALASVERDGSYVLAAFRVGGPGGATRDAPAPLVPNDLPVLDPAGARSVLLTMEGGAMRGLPDGAVWEGTRMTMRELAEFGQFWAFNGVAGMTDAPLAEIARGEVLRIPMANRTAFPHAMHLHGTHFREVLPGGGLGPWRDTLLVLPGENREIAFVAETAGDWMFHCHMLSHQMSGMMNWIRVT